MDDYPFLTTDEDFAYFKKRVNHWLLFWGLSNWRVYVEHDKVDNALADCSADLDGYVATIRLSTSWNRTKPTHEAIDTTALHEVCHVLLDRLEINAGDRYVTRDEIKESGHEIIRRIETVFTKLGIVGNEAA